MLHVNVGGCGGGGDDDNDDDDKEQEEDKNSSSVLAFVSFILFYKCPIHKFSAL